MPYPRIFYHATWCGNIPSIKEKGLISRTEQEAEQMVDNILAEYGLTRDQVPKWRWQYALSRLKDTAGRVHLSADPMFALQNCLAGFEAEAELRGNLKSFREKKKSRYLTVEEIARRRGDVSCGICQVELYDNEIDDFDHYKNSWERIAPEQKQHLGLETFEDYLQLLMREGIEIVVKGSIPPNRIKDCGCIGPAVSGFERKEYAQRAFEVYRGLGKEMPEERRERYEQWLKGET